MQNADSDHRKDVAHTIFEPSLAQFDPDVFIIIFFFIYFPNEKHLQL